MPSSAAEPGPITRLPDEVLSIVFFYYAVCLHDSLKLALHTPILWSFFSLWTLDDSNLRDQQLRLSLVSPQVNTTFALLEPHKDRVQDLEICAGVQMIGNISPHLRDNWKNLRHLSLWSEKFQYNMPARVAQYLIPGLCSLRLINVRVDWTCVRHVRHLKVAGNYQWGSITIKALSDVLRACPTLQTLELYDCVYEVDTIHRPAELPHMRRFEIRASSDVCSSALGLMSLHPSAAILIDTDNRVNAMSIRPLLVRLCKHLNARGRPPRLRSLKFISTYPGNCREINCWMRFLWDDCLPFTHKQGANAILETTQLELRVVLPSARELHRIVAKVLNIVPTHAVEVLDMRSSTYTPTRALRALLRGLPAIRSIYLASRAVNVSVLEFILHLIENGSLQGSPCAPYKKPLEPPALEQIFWDTRTIIMDGADKRMEMIRAISKLLEAYKRVGRPIRQVFLSKRPDGMPAAVVAEMARMFGEGFVCPGPTYN
ncbi:hypothetical protein FB107DRAFT_285131 [Schizophyllum commune]